jgi:DNA-binding transcriptional ArsR family regulator
MDIVKINATLSNKTRYEIMRWLKNPEKNFPAHTEVNGFDDGVCVSFIKDKAGLSQSTISHYLNMMENAQLIVSTRIGKWTYYKRNEKVIDDYFIEIRKDL